MNDIRLKASVEVDASGAVTPLKSTREEMDRLAASGQNLSRSASVAGAAMQRQNLVQLDAVKAARQSRIAYQQLGFQISDVAAQASTGVNPMVIFAQQGGQIAQALSGFRGVLGSTAAFLAGPWGAALLGAVSIGGMLLLKQRELNRAQEEGRKTTSDLRESIDLLNAAMGLNISTAEALAERERVATREKLESARATLEQAKAELTLAQAREQVLLQQQRIESAGEGRRALGLGAARQGAIASGAAERIAQTEIQIGELTDRLLQQQAALFTKSYADRTREAEESARRRSEAERAAARAAAEAAREAQAALEAQRRELEAIARAALRAGQALAAMPQGLFAVEEARRRATAATAIPGPDLLSDVRARAEQRRQADFDARAAEAEGRAIAQEATREMIRNAARIGQAIGGKAGDVISRVAGLADIASGDFSGAGRAGGIIGSISQAGDILGSAKSIITGAKDAIGGLLSGTTGLLGALGPIGAAAGAIASIAGPLIKALQPSQRGKVTLTGGGEVVIGATGGNNAQNRSNAETLAGSFASALGQIADRLDATIGQFAVTVGIRNDQFTVDPSGRNLTRGAGVQTFSSGEQALAAALADALRDGAIAGVSPAVQLALRTYASDLNKATAEALKVQELEQLLAGRDNPFLKAARDFERQAEERLRIARQYGFDILAIERLNAEERKKLQEETARSVAGSVRDLLDELRFGRRAEGSVVDRLAAIGAERSRLEGLAAGGDNDAANQLARIIEQQLDLAREGFGTTGRFAELRGGAIETLEAVLRQTESRIAEASLQAQRQTVEKLTEANQTLDEQTLIQQQMLAAIERLNLGGSGTSGAGFDASLFARQIV